MKNRRFTLSPLLLPALLLLLTSQAAKAGSATWNSNPASGDWNTAANWTPQTVPNGPADVATFGSSNTTAISVSGVTSVASIQFSSGASSYIVTSEPLGTFGSLAMTGQGETNDSRVTQTFVGSCDGAGGQGGIGFANDATAARNTIFIAEANPVRSKDGAITSFVDSSSGGEGMFINNGGVVSNGSQAALCLFFARATAGHGTIINNGGLVSGAKGGLAIFEITSRAGNALITSNGATVSGAAGGLTQFVDSSRALNATLIANGGLNGGGGGVIEFDDSSTGDRARVEVFGTGSMNLSFHSPPGMTLGSIEGDGLIFLGGTILEVGNNGLSTSFSGSIQNGDFAGGGSLIKIGPGALSLTGANLYDGGTTVREGTLVISNTAGSATGPGPVFVNSGTLGGGGIIAETVTVGSGGGSGAFLAPAHGTNKQATLTIQNVLTFNADGTYSCELNSNSATVDQIVADGVTIKGGASFSLIARGNGTLALGTVFTVISNTAATPISGTFANLPDGAILTANGNNFQASYEGGDGNDLALTVVP